MGDKNKRQIYAFNDTRQSSKQKLNKNLLRNTHKIRLARRQPKLRHLPVLSGPRSPFPAKASISFQKARFSLLRFPKLSLQNLH
ncbi:hypothetical protein TIFTF001_002858 [Ficus carica]|uniref:Uncharacterized protein n=1 Tax=Ficus carica TaxID=3494 RepID=A0AA88D911_FICCA|nr:hypothetical protein TIFTF001_002858 [Ficus carica]